MNFLEQLYQAEPVYFIVASVSSVLYLLKLSLFSIFGIDKDLDLGAVDAGAAGAEVSFKLLTTQTLLVFLMSMGWLGLAARVEFGLTHAIAAALACVFGFIMMVFAAYLTKILFKLNKIPFYNRWSLIGTRARVYLTIPPKGSGEGEVEIHFAGGKKILKAHNVDRDEIPSFSEVIVTGIEGKNLIVKKIDK